MDEIMFADDSEVESLASSLCDLSLPKSQWSHSAHFATAVWLLRHRAGFVWQRDMPNVIRRYNEATGNPNTDRSGYHATITIASMRAAEHFLHALGQGMATYQAANALLGTRLGSKDWLLDHWRHETLFSVAARRDWLEPDLAPLPF